MLFRVGNSQRVVGQVFRAAHSDYSLSPPHSGRLTSHQRASNVLFSPRQFLCPARQHLEGAIRRTKHGIIRSTVSGKPYLGTSDGRTHTCPRAERLRRLLQLLQQRRPQPAELDRPHAPRCGPGHQLSHQVPGRRHFTANNMDEEKLANSLKSAIKSEGLAQKEDLTDIYTTFRKHVNRMADTDKQFNDLEKSLELAEAALVPTTPTSLRIKPARLSSISTCSSTSTGTWTPRLALVKVFAALGYPNVEQLRKEPIQQTITRAISRDLARSLAPMAGFALNHSRSSVAHPVTRAASPIASTNGLRNAFQACRMVVRAVPEAHPVRRRA